MRWSPMPSELGIAVSTLDCGTRIIDCGVKAAGSIEAGRRLAEVCMAGLGDVEIRAAATQDVWQRRCRRT